MSLFKMKRGQESKVNSLAKEDGSLIFSLDGANNSTFRLDQNINGTVQRLGIAVDKAKDANSVIDYNEPTRHIKIGYAGAGLSTANLTHIAGYTNNGTQIKDVSKDVLKNWLGASDSANKLNPTITLTKGDGNTTGYRLIATISLGAWSNYRAVFIARSRHQGAGYLTITIGNNTSSITYDNTYSEITYWGPTGSGTVIASDSYQVRVSSDGKKAYVFWKYEDYSPTAIYVISSDFTISNGTWMTSITEATYGKVKAYTSINNAQSLQGSSLSQILNTVGGGNAFTGLDTTTNNKIKLTRANGGTVEKTINNVSNASTASFASVSAYPQGFESRTTSATWGNTTGTFITGWHTASGGDIAFMNDNPSSGKVSMKLDGYFYQNEGANRVLDTADAANYVKKAGDTMTGLLTLKTGNQQGIKLGSAWMTAASDSNGEFVLQNGHLRFGSSDWDYNKWAGLKYDAGKKNIYLGLADGTIFTANSAQSGGNIFTPGINNIYVGASTATKVLTSANIGDYASGKTAFTELDTTTNNVIKLTRANGATVQKTINNVAKASTAEYAKNAAKLGGVEADKYAKKEDIPAIPSNLDVANRLQSYVSAGNISNSLFYRYGILSSSWSNFPVSTLPSTGIGANFQGKNTGVLHIAAGSSYHDLAFTAGAKDNQGILYAGTGRNPAYILDTENYKTKGNVFNSLTANTSFTAKVNVTIDGGSY